jgi:archaemetzincin
VPAEEIEILKEALDSVYNARIIILEQTPAPGQAFVNIKTPPLPRRQTDCVVKAKQTRHARLCYWLNRVRYFYNQIRFLGRVKEPKSRYEDFGIFGLGYKPGKSCVVSYFRLGSDALKLKDRLAKISVHEIGHNLGLDHCKNKRCVMTDAVEKISTIDNAEMRLCSKCRDNL